MKALQSLLSLHESARQEARFEKLSNLFGFGETEAEQAYEFAIKQRDWEDLGQDTRERLYSHYQKTMPYGTAKAKTGDPYVFILGALRSDLGLR